MIPGGGQDSCLSCPIDSQDGACHIADNAPSSHFTSASLACHAWRILAWRERMQARANSWVSPNKQALDVH